MSKKEFGWYSVTLTFRLNVSIKAAKKVYALFLRKLRDGIRPEKIRHESVLEKGEENGNLHFHTFLGSTNHALKKRRIKKLWFKLAGFVKFDATDDLIKYHQKTLKDPFHPERVFERDKAGKTRSVHPHSTKWGEESSHKSKIKKAVLRHDPAMKLARKRGLD